MPETWIEGIESLRSLFSIITPQPTCACYKDLFCHKSNNVSYYIKAPFQDCYDETVSVNEFKKTETSVTIFPNPFEETTTIKVNNTLTNFTITIYNTLGQKVKQLFSESETTIHLKSEGLKEGIYYCCLIKDTETISTQKLIINR